MSEPTNLMTNPAIPLPELDRLHAEASPGPWRAGRSDMTSYDGNTGEAFKNVYGPEHEKHPRTGADIPLTVARGESERCHANAAWIATIHNTWPTISARLKELEDENAQLRRLGPASHVLEEMFERGWTFDDLCNAMQADDTDRVALELLLFVGPHEPNMRLGVMAEKLDRAFGVSDGFFANLEREWIEPRGPAEVVEITRGEP